MTINFLFAICMHLAALAFFNSSNLSAISRMGGKAACRERVAMVGNDELPGLSAKLPPAKLQKSLAAVRWLGHSMSVRNVHF